MASLTALFIAIPIAAVLSGTLAKFGFDMKKDNNLTPMWGYFFWSVVPFALVALMWASQEGVDLTSRNIVLGIVGAACGATGLIWVGYLVEGRTKVTDSPTPKAEATQNSIGNINGNSGIITQGQKGDNR